MHWIEEAEQHKNKHSNTRETIHDRIDKKKVDVNANWDIIKADYLALISKLENYIDRINNLPRDSRLEFGRIEAKEKESSLHNHLIKYTSSRRRIIRKFSGLFSPYKARHYKNSRNVFLSISRETDYILVETKEITAPRIRLDENIESTFQWFFRYFKIKEKPIVNRAKNKMKISELDDEFALYFIDFLAFRNDGKRHFLVN